MLTATKKKSNRNFEKTHSERKSKMNALVEAIKEQQKIIEELKVRISNLEL